MNTRLLTPLLLLFLISGFFFYRFAINTPDDYHKREPKCEVQKIFADLGASTNEVYQTVALQQLVNKAPSDYRYYFKTFLEEGATYMLTNFRNEEECFDVKILVDKWDKLAGMKRTNGNSYPKELYDLKWKLQDINGKKKVIYQDMHRIID